MVASSFVRDCKAILIATKIKESFKMLCSVGGFLTG